MKSTYNISQAQKNLPQIVRSLSESGFVGISLRDHTKAFLISTDQMTAIIETMEILSNEHAMNCIHNYKSNQLRFSDLNETSS
ncbi:MAG TPA: hypothetical protein DHV51_01195 [Opitutae bacterium]|nr:hypothetical protein [Opitutae bacterium]